MKSIFEKIKQWIIKYQNDIILVAGVILISLLSFAMGYIVAKQGEKEPLKIEQNIMQISCESYANNANCEYKYSQSVD